MNFKIIATDFDGTLCENKWPEIGEPNKEIINYLLAEKKKGSKLILWTCRTKWELQLAIEWCEKHGLCFDAVNANLPEIVESFNGESRKIFAHEYIDDRMCTMFKFPFVKIETGITDEIICKLEPVFGFPLYDWQKQYLKGEIDTFPNGRNNGKTFAYCIRLLLGKHEPFDLHDTHEIDKLVDENHGPHYDRFFRHYLCDLNKQLLEASFSTNAHERQYFEGVFTKAPFSF